MPFIKGRRAIIPSVVLNILFSIFAILNFVMDIYDLESRREYQSSISYNLLDAYVFHPKRDYTEITYSVSNAPEIITTGGVNGTSSSIASALHESPGHWTFLIILILLTVIGVITLICIYKHTFVMSLVPASTDIVSDMLLDVAEVVPGKKEPTKSSEKVSEIIIENNNKASGPNSIESINNVELSENKYMKQLNDGRKRNLNYAIKKCTRSNYKKASPNIIAKRSKGVSLKDYSIAYWTYPLNITILCFGVIALVTIPIYMTSPEYSPFMAAAPVGYILTKDFLINYPKISDEEYLESTKEAREQLAPYIELEGQMYLDTRDVPIYPLMHGELEDFCYLNSSDEKCQDVDLLEKNKKRHLKTSLRHSSTKTSEDTVFEFRDNTRNTETNAEDNNGNNEEDPLSYPGDETEYDVFVLIIESFSPTSMFVDDEMKQIFQSNPENVFYKFENIDNPGIKGPTGYYNKDLLPNLHNLSGSGSFAVFPGLSSMSLPTINGWFSLLSQTHSFGNQGNIEGYYMHTGSVFSIAGAMGFKTYYHTPSPLDFDGKDGLLYKLPPKHEAIARELQKIKKNKKDYEELIERNWKFTDKQWEETKDEYAKIKDDAVFDNLRALDVVLYSMPYDELMDNMKDYLTVKYPPMKDADYHVPTTNSSWICDRVTSLQFLYYFQHFEDGDLLCDIDRVIMAEKGKKEHPIEYPIFAGYANVSTHTPFLGFDDDTEAEGIKESDPVDKRYSRIMHKMDDYFIGRTIDFLKSRERDSVVFIVGDHGARVTDLDSNTNEHCRTFDLGGEQFYTTTAMVGYIKGTREGERKNKFLDKYGDLLGYVYNAPLDHSDLTATMLAVASLDVDRDGPRLGIPPNPSTGRNIFEVMRAALDSNNPLHDWSFISYSMVAIQKEIRLHSSTSLVLRGHVYSQKDYIVLKTGGEGANGALIYPSCIDEGGELSEEVRDQAVEMQDAFERMKNYYRHIHLNDMIFNPHFITDTELPGPYPKVQKEESPWIMGLIVLVALPILLILIYTITYIVLAVHYHLCSREK